MGQTCHGGDYTAEILNEKPCYEKMRTTGPARISVLLFLMVQTKILRTKNLGRLQ
jgi:hypothetical protein